MCRDTFCYTHRVESDLKIRKSNQLIEAAYSGGTIWKMRLLHLAIHQVNSKTTRQTKIRLEAGDMADLIGREMSGAYYKELAAAADDLIGTVITVPLMHEGKERRRGKTKLTMVSRCDYLPGEGAVVLQFNEWLLPYIQQLGRHYKELDLWTIVKMKSAYGIRLYELVKVWCWPEVPEGRTKKITVQDFKKLLKIEKLKSYRDIRALRRWVIEPGIKDVNNHSEYSVKVGYQKSGRTITHIQFHIVKNVPETPAEASRSALLDTEAGDEFLAVGGSLEDYVTICGRAGAWRGMDRPAAIQAAQKEIDGGQFRNMKTGKLQA